MLDPATGPLQHWIWHGSGWQTGATRADVFHRNVAQRKARRPRSMRQQSWQVRRWTKARPPREVLAQSVAICWQRVAQDGCIPAGGLRYGVWRYRDADADPRHPHGFLTTLHQSWSARGLGF
jgi:hypothetical protein